MKILIVDDEKGIRDVIKEYAYTQGFDVEEAEDLIKEFEFNPFTFHENYVKNDKPLKEGDNYENRI